MVQGPARVRRGRISGSRHWLPLRLLLCLFLLANPLPGFAAGTHGAGGGQPADTAAAHPCHGAAPLAAALPESPLPGCPHCSGDGPAATCTCCDLGTSSVPPLVLAVPARQEVGPVTVLGRLPDTLPRSPGERRYRPPIDAV